ncbi:MAG: hypothetical protein QOH01_912 [Verrucomicrobiota bacterium]
MAAIEIKTDGAVAADKVTVDTATGAHAVNLVDAEMGADVKLTPRLNEHGRLCLIREE